MPNLNRPKPGTITVSEVSCQICSECGCVIETGLCDSNCRLDGEPRRPQDWFTAHYKRTDEFLRDEPGNADA